ncbi:thioredoxin-dependent thiol peroxidase [Desulfurobacterium sp.]|uniref:thioredoxin-dependent thiol peroxidase n=1 Tax=Desulfurobacterium sp. TaxID=2004706 RepID=UPI00263330C8|nr:thioredoxin-dependent thiol peroxidase [Desulfurobacterium sp.]
MVEPGKIAPGFCLKDDTGKETCLKNFKGNWVVLYFYPKDNTPGCTKEAEGFTEKLGEFKKLNSEVIGISPDSVESHKKFKEKRNLKVTLLSDPEHKVIEEYGAWKLKKRFGKEYYGVVRTTYLIDPDGKVAHVWKNVRVKGHVEKVLEMLKKLSEK